MLCKELESFLSPDLLSFRGSAQDFVLYKARVARLHGSTVRIDQCPSNILDAHEKCANRSHCIVSCILPR
ncbi:hypothetical protein CLOM_g1604 [Closterium sp. NIES-68]|nr:hypothetical protein CLOM_g1604 [Closterium sp. NIES-68]